MSCLCPERLLQFVFAVWVLSLLSALAVAQQVDVAVRPPHFIGEPALIQVIVQGLDEDPQPTCGVERTVPGLDLQSAGVHPNISESVTIINGRVSRSKTVVFRFNFYATTDRVGQYTVGPFRITQGGQQLKSDPVTLQFQDVEKDPDMWVRLVLPDEPVFPGQEVPVQIEWGYAEDLSAVRNLRIRSTLFDQFSFIDQPVRRGQTALPIQTNRGELSIGAQVREEEMDGRRYTVITGQRILVPDQPGEYSFPSVTASIHKVVRWQRDFFGDRRPVTTKPARAQGRPGTLIVSPLPQEGRPDSFAGAIGRGYTIGVAANRTVVRVGDPITLTVTVQGEGNLENVGLPRLSADGGLSPEHFRLPNGDISGIYEDGRKVFEVKNVRVLDTTANEIPAIAYSWFDPERVIYETARSKPIALRVDPARMVSSRDVISSVREGPELETPDSTARLAAGMEEKAQAAGSQPGRYVWSGADLAIEQDRGRVLEDARTQFRGVPVQAVMYIFSFVLLAWVLVDRRRRNVDPRVLERRKSLRESRRRVACAEQMSLREGAQEVAAALRVMVAAAPQNRPPELDSVLSECDSLIYAPGDDDGQQLDTDLLERASTIADTIIREAE